MNNKKKFLFAFTAVALLSLSACGGNNNNSQSSEPFNPIKGLDPLDQETTDAIKEKIAVVDSDGIYGNIYLPESVGGAQIIWDSSNQEIINPNWDGDMAPGVVNRPYQD